MEKNHVIITGMHRSGTSYLARALNLSGLDLGPISQYYDSEIKPVIGNVKGHWENVKINELNEEFLKINGGAWDIPPDDYSIMPDDFNNKINSILTQFHLQKSLAYGFKDPRFCLTLEEWIPTLSNFTLIGIFRHPLKVAESLKIRNNFNYSKSLNLWEIHNKKLLKLIKKYGGFLIDFDWPKEKLLKETTLICKKLGLTEIVFDNWFSTDLKRSDKSFISDYKLSENILQIYDELKLSSTNNSNVHDIIPKLSVGDYREILRDTILNSNSFYENTVNTAINEIDSLKKINSKITSDPFGNIIQLFYSRDDLQNTFPEVFNGDYSNLLNWTNDVITDKIPSETLTKEIILSSQKWLINDPFKIQEVLLQNDTIVKQQDELTLQKHDNLDLTNDLSKLKTENSTLSEKFFEIQEKHLVLNDKIENLSGIIQTKHEEVSLLEENLTKIQYDYEKSMNELNRIRSSFGFKLLRLYGSSIDRIRSKQDLQNTQQVTSASINSIKNEGMKTFLHRANAKIKRREFSIATQDVSETSKKQPSISNYKFRKLPWQNTIKIISSRFDVSVVIPTNSSIESISPTINGLLSQIGIKNLEIILINSGKFDLSALESNQIKIISIPSSEFNHGSTRNLGAEQAIYEYLVFLTDDAIPILNDLLYRLCDSLYSEPKAAVATGIQIPRSDSDLLYEFFINNHYKFLNLNSDRVAYAENYDKLENDEKRIISQIDDVCSCYRRDIFLQYKYKKIQYAEDLDMGLRLVKDGFLTIQLISAAVIHSHNRSPFYYCKRGTVDVLMVNDIIGIDSMDFDNISFDELINIFYSMYVSLNNTTPKLFTEINKPENNPENIPLTHLFFKLLINSIKNPIKTNNNNKMDSDFKQIFTLLNNKQPIMILNYKHMELNYIQMLNDLRFYVHQNFKNISNMENELNSAIHKLLGWYMGTTLGNYILYCKSNNKTEYISKIEKSLVGNI
jgi:hypothetical protein